MDLFDAPDHGRRLYESSGIKVVTAGFDPAKQAHPDSSVAPRGGPDFPATDDVEISGVPT